MKAYGRRGEPGGAQAATDESPRGEERELAALVGHLADSPEASFVVATDGTIVYWNQAAAHLFQVAADGALGRPCPSVVHGRTDSGESVCRAGCEALHDALLGRSAAPMEMLVDLGQPRRSCCVRVHHLSLVGRNGRALGVLHLVEDVQERRRRERVGTRFLALTAAQPAVARDAVEADLTPREGEVLALLAQGRTAREIAACLQISHATARTHVQRILAKLGASSRMAAVARVLAGERANGA